MRFAVEKAGCFHQSRWRGILPARFPDWKEVQKEPKRRGVTMGQHQIRD